MNPRTSRAIALAAIAAISGCVAMPNIPPVQVTTSELTGVGEPFEVKTERETVDVVVDIAASDALTLDAVVRLALKHDPSVQASLARVRQAEAESRQTRLLPNPILSLAVRFPEGGSGKPVIDAGVTADLLSLLLRPGRISAADGRLRKSTADALVVVLDVLLNVQQQYVKVQALTARVAIDESRRTTLEEIVRVTEARIKGGEAARLDVLTIQSEQVNLETELLGRKSEERQARITLARMLGAPSSAAMWQLGPWTEPAAIGEDENSWLALAHEKRPELQAITWELSALGDDLSVARFSTFTGSQVGVDSERDGDWTVGPAAAFPIPFFDMGQAERERVHALIVEQRHELTKAERQVVQEVRIALEQLRSARLALNEVERRLIPLQEERLTQARNSYRLGMADILAVRLAEQDRQRAHAQQVDLQEQVSQANFQLMRAAAGTVAVAPSTQPTTN